MEHKHHKDNTINSRNQARDHTGQLEKRMLHHPIRPWNGLRLVNPLPKHHISLEPEPLADRKRNAQGKLTNAFLKWEVRRGFTAMWQRHHPPPPPRLPPETMIGLTNHHPPRPSFVGTKLLVDPKFGVGLGHALDAKGRGIVKRSQKRGPQVPSRRPRLLMTVG